LISISAVTGAEYFRDEQKKDILFFADNMYRYVQARNELSTILDQVPNEGGYEPTIFSDVKNLQDRLSSNENGSITSVQTIYVPADDLSDPAVQMIQHELDSIIVLSRKIAEQGIRPAVDLSSTTSSLLTPAIVGDRHYDLSVKTMSLLQKYESLKSIIAIIGENELSPSDRADYAKAKQLIANFTQNMNVMEKHIGIPGDTFTREQTLKSIEDIIEGNVSATTTEDEKTNEPVKPAPSEESTPETEQNSENKDDKNPEDNTDVNKDDKHEEDKSKEDGKEKHKKHRFGR
jgi:F-type H+-transporting ATPase subunit beta